MLFAQLFALELKTLSRAHLANPSMVPTDRKVLNAGVGSWLISGVTRCRQWMLE
ncbi:hypothetical protein LIA77_03775 [Sarocladium implicatum]|nr:hypothetical protein LIA77_03775 [Sarocladium implicatum]